MAGEQEVILRRDCHCIAREGCGVDSEGTSHCSRDAVRMSSSANPPCTSAAQRDASANSHFRIFLSVCDGSQGQAEIRDRSPEICRL